MQLDGLHLTKRQILMWQRFSKFSYWKELTFVFLFKIIALFMLWYFCFSPDHKQHLNSELVAERILTTEGS